MMTWRFKKILEVLGLRPTDNPPRIFVSLNVFNARHPTRLSSSSTRVIIRVSIWTLLMLLLAFMIVYTSLLVYVDSTFLQKTSGHATNKHKRIRLTGRLKMHPKIVNHALNMQIDNYVTVQRKAVWNTSLFYNDDVELPQCKWQAVFRILITSAPKGKLKRQAIRETWCNPESFGEDSSKWHCIFLVGLTNDSSLNDDIRKENRENGDILFGNYFDSYENLTLKVIHGFNWSMHHCPSSFVVKTDDDCFVNAAKLHKFLLYNNTLTNNLYVGRIVKDKRKLKVVRQADQKWFVPYKDYSEEYYHPYASGMGYIMSKDVVERIVQESAFVHPIVNEDAYIGIVVHHLNITPTSSNRFVLSALYLNICNHSYLFIIHDVSPETQREVLNKTLRSRDECSHHKSIHTWS